MTDPVPLCSDCHRAQYGFGPVACGHYTVAHTVCASCQQVELTSPCNCADALKRAS